MDNFDDCKEPPRAGGRPLCPFPFAMQKKKGIKKAPQM
jgi:hypothetical protein